MYTIVCCGRIQFKLSYLTLNNTPLWPCGETSTQESHVLAPTLCGFPFPLLQSGIFITTTSLLSPSSWTWAPATRALIRGDNCLVMHLLPSPTKEGPGAEPTPASLAQVRRGSRAPSAQKQGGV